MANPVKLQAEVAAVTPYGDGVYELRLKPLGRVPRYKPGQFLHLSIDEYDQAGGYWPESRVFSIASGYGLDDLVLTYSVKGKYTKRMEEFLSAGKTVWLKLPYGDFIIDSSIKPGQDVVLVAGGTGISPYIPFLDAYAKGEGEAGRKISLHYGARKRGLIMFRELLRDCAACDGFSLSVAIEDEPSDGIDIEGARLQDGRLDIRGIMREAGDLRDPVFFLSGPPTMIRAFTQGILDSGIAESNVKTDEWE